MAGAWLVWLGGIVGVVFAVLLAAGGFAFPGLFLGAIIWLAARSAAAPKARQEVDETVRRACKRLPFCDCD